MDRVCSAKTQSNSVLSEGLFGYLQTFGCASGALPKQKQELLRNKLFQACSLSGIGFAGADRGGGLESTLHAGRLSS